MHQQDSALPLSNAEAPILVPSQPGDFKLISNSMLESETTCLSPQNQLLLIFSYPVPQVLGYANVPVPLVPLVSNTATIVEPNTCQLAGPSPSMTIIGNLSPSPSAILCPGPSPELKTIPTVLQHPAPAPVRLISATVAGQAFTNSTVTYLVQPGDFNNGACTAAPTSTQNNSNMSPKNQVQKKSGFSEEIIGILKSWLFQNILKPYPTEAKKKELLNLTGLTLSQLNNWLINSRRRILKRLLLPPEPEGDNANFNGRAARTRGRVSTRYVNMWKHGGGAKIVNNENVQRDESETTTMTMKEACAPSSVV